MCFVIYFFASWLAWIRVQHGCLFCRAKFHVTFLHSKDCTPSIQEVTKAIPDIGKDVLTTKVINTKLDSVVAKDEVTAQAKRKTKQDLDKNVLTAVTKQKAMPEVVKNEFAIKVINQNSYCKQQSSLDQ